MLRKTSFSMWMIAALAGAVGLVAAACGSSGGTGAGKCTANTTQACLCGVGENGIQTCAADGSSFSVCSCGSGAGGASTGTASTTGTTSTGPSVTVATSTSSGNVCATCGLDGSPCPPQCMDAGKGGSGGTGGAGGNSCASVAVYAGMVPGVPSIWGNASGAMGKVGVEAGTAMCVALGADHVCEYAEVQKAVAKGEFANVASGTTAWLLRTTMAMVTPATELGAGTMSAPGPGGQCNNWNYGTNHLSDGEHVDWTDGTGVPTFYIDNDTIFDPNPPSTPGPHTHHNPTALSTLGLDPTESNDFMVPLFEGCNSEMRAILCCFPACT
jgi:hypothetical protein